MTDATNEQMFAIGRWNEIQSVPTTKRIVGKQWTVASDAEIVHMTRLICKWLAWYTHCPHIVPGESLHVAARVFGQLNTVSGEHR